MERVDVLDMTVIRPSIQPTTDQTSDLPLLQVRCAIGTKMSLPLRNAQSQRNMFHAQGKSPFSVDGLQDMLGRGKSCRLDGLCQHKVPGQLRWWG